MTLVSICIPAYKQPQLLKKAIDTILMQSYTNYEIIVSDDTPDDSIKEIIDQFNEPKIKYFKNEKPLGSPQNWNNAIKQAKGDYIKVLHHDDYFSEKDSLKKFVSALDSGPEIDFAFSYSDIYFKKINEHFLHKQSNVQLRRLKIEPEFLFFRNVIGAPSSVIFKNDKTIVFNKEFKWLVDVEFYINYLKKHKNFICIKEALVTVVDGSEEQISQELAFNREVVLNENLNLFSAIYSDKLNTKKSLLFFQELFLQFEIYSFDELKRKFEIPQNINGFLIDVFIDMPKNALLKKFKKRLLTSRYNKRIFKIERY
ncbi:MAG: glycosyltransferase [Bacteroidota bacterium]|nr:glycosyltransferase [Bacteroidota bacterium]MDP3145213.1 glycosyltransferase [Bacteroidota bacterium]MDP3557262.1 glycosyltransferase [Bacteroidota bacterium]